MKNLIFILSLPRSGSTLIQRSICSSCNIRSEAEPWVLLPAVTILSKRVEVQASYDAKTCATAIDEYFEKVGRERAIKAIRSFAFDAYDLSEGPFLEKTPRYSLIFKELIEIFPESKFIVLFRNPLSVVNSMLMTWGDSGRRWRIRPYGVDLYDGLAEMCDVARIGLDNVKAVRYEDFLGAPQAIVDDLAAFSGLNVERKIDLAYESAVSLTVGSVGDKVGVSRYKEVQSEGGGNLDVFCNSYRRWYARRYINWIGEDRLALMGYSKKDLLLSVDECRGQKLLLKDLFEMIFQFIKVVMPFRRFRDKSVFDKNIVELR